MYSRYQTNMFPVLIFDKGYIDLIDSNEIIEGEKEFKTVVNTHKFANRLHSFLNIFVK